MDIELILVTKNDGYCGDPIQRLLISLEHNLRVTPASWQFTVVDWASEGESVEDAVRAFDTVGELDGAIKSGRLRFAKIPKDVAARFDTPLSEVHALNYAARHARCPMVGRIDQDTMIGQGFVDWAVHRDYNPDLFYFSNRRDLPRGELAGGGSAPVNGDVNHHEYVSCPVGILLVPRDAWCDLRGYDETMIWYNHMEREFIRRLDRRCQLVNLGILIGVHFYHIWHEHSGLQKRQNPSLSLEEYRSRQIIQNGPGWGLAGLVGAP